MKCKHFYITFDQRNPKGCKAYGIKSQQMPKMVVKAANNGSECIGFEAKPDKSKSKDLADSRYW